MSPVTCPPPAERRKKSQEDLFPRQRPCSPGSAISCMAHILSRASLSPLQMDQDTFSKIRLTSPITQRQANRSGVFR